MHMACVNRLQNYFVRIIQTIMIVPEVNELDLVKKKHCKSIVRDYFGIKADRHRKILAGSDSNLFVVHGTKL